MKKLLLLSLLTFLTASSFSQNDVPQNRIKKTLELDGSSFQKEIKLMVREEKTLRYSVKGKITGGKFDVKIYDPNGKKENGFLLSTMEGGNAKGNLIEVNTDPIPGIWVFKIDNSKSKGSISLSAFQNNRGL